MRSASGSTSSWSQATATRQPSACSALATRRSRSLPNGSTSRFQATPRAPTASASRGNSSAGSPRSSSSRLPASRHLSASSARLSRRNHSRAGAMSVAPRIAGSSTNTPVSARLVAAAWARERLSARRRSRRCQNNQRSPPPGSALTPAVASALAITAPPLRAPAPGGPGTRPPGSCHRGIHRRWPGPHPTRRAPAPAPPGPRRRRRRGASPGG